MMMKQKFPKKKQKKIHQKYKHKKQLKILKTTLCKENPKILAVKNTTYDLIPTQTTLTLTDTRKHRQEITSFQRFIPVCVSPF